MADTKTSRKVEGPVERKLRGIVATHRAASGKSGTIDMKGAVQAAIVCVEGFFPRGKRYSAGRGRVTARPLREQPV